MSSVVCPACRIGALACTNCGEHATCDTLPAPPPSPSAPAVTRPSSPKAIRLADLAKAIEDMEKAAETCGLGTFACPRCGKDTPHHHYD